MKVSFSQNHSNKDAHMFRFTFHNTYESSCFRTYLIYVADLFSLLFSFVGTERGRERERGKDLEMRSAHKTYF